MEQQEYLLRLSILQQEAERIGQENENIIRQILELQELKNNLEVFKNSKNEDSLVSFGKGIFTEAHIKDKDLFVNIGSNVIVKKSIPETVELIDEQASKLEQVKEELAQHLGSLNMQLNALISSAKQS